jgi:hypothetical protein
MPRTTVAAGWLDLAWLRTDPELVPLHKEVKFGARRAFTLPTSSDSNEKRILLHTLPRERQRRAFTPAVILFIALPETQDNIEPG